MVDKIWSIWGFELKTSGVGTDHSTNRDTTTGKASISQKGLHSIEVEYLILTQQSQVPFSAFPRIFLYLLLKFIDDIA